MRVIVRPWVVGVTLIVFAVASHAAFKVDPLPGRIEMGAFACFEFVLYAAGLGTLLWTLVTSPLGCGSRILSAALWIVAALAGLYAVIDSLPP